MIAANDFNREPETLRINEVAAVERVVRSGWWILGQETKAFEQAWSAFLDVKFAVGVGNGMDALEIGLRACGIGPGHEVITTPMTAFATVLAILRAGATPVLADVDPDTGNLCPASVTRCLTPRTKAVMVVHLYGQAADLGQLVPLCEERGVALVEDCAQAHGARWNGRALGTFGVFAGWSFYPTKNLGAIGDGGALTTNSEPVAEMAGKLRNYGQSTRYHHPVAGLNSRLDEIQSAILRERLRYLPEWNEKRRKIAEQYAREIRNPLIRLLPLPLEAERHVHHLTVLTCLKRDALQQHLQQGGVQTLCHYPVPIHHQEPCRNLARDPQGLRVAEQHATTCLSLPSHPGLTADEISHVVQFVNEFAI